MPHTFKHLVRKKLKKET